MNSSAAEASAIVPSGCSQTADAASPVAAVAESMANSAPSLAAPEKAVLQVDRLGPVDPEAASPGSSSIPWDPAADASTSRFGPCPMQCSCSACALASVRPAAKAGT